MKRNSSSFFIFIVIAILGLNTLSIPTVWSQALNIKGQTESFLPADQAFILQTEIDQNNQIILHWTIADGYYLYRDQITLEVGTQNNREDAQGTLTTLAITFPPAKIIQDPYFGEQAIYENSLELIIPELTHKNVKADALTIHYQGCAVKGLCYPPVTQSFDLSWGKDHKLNIEAPKAKQTNPYIQTVSFPASQPEAVLPLTQQNAIYFDASLIKTLLTFFGFGVLLSFTPCVLPMLPILSTVIVGQKKLNLSKAFLLSLIYTISMSLVLALLGIVAVALGKNLQALFQQPIIITMFAGLFLYLGLTQLGIGILGLPGRVQQRLHQWQSQFPAGSYLNAFVMGALAMLIASPCVSAPLVGALSFIAQTNHYFYGASTLFCLGLGMGTVLMLVGTLGGHYLPKAGAWMHIVNKIFASLLFGLSIWILSRILNAYLSISLWAVWCLLNAYWLGTFSKPKEISSRIGVLFVVAACFIGLFVAQGETDPAKQFSRLWQPESTQAHTPPLVFDKIESLTDLEQRLSTHPNQPTLLKAYADWCASCKYNEKIIFSHPETYMALKNWQLLVVDMTEMTSDKQQLVNHLDIFGPPVVLFFNSEGKERSEYRLVGKNDRESFLATVEKFTAQATQSTTAQGNFN